MLHKVYNKAVKVDNTPHMRRNMDRFQYDKDDIVICPHCSGTGQAFIRVPNYVDSYGRMTYHTVLETCMLCEGRRAVKLETKFLSLGPAVEG